MTRALFMPTLYHAQSVFVPVHNAVVGCICDDQIPTVGTNMYPSFPPNFQYPDSQQQGVGTIVTRSGRQFHC